MAYDFVESAMNMARTRLNDAIGQGLSGEVFTDTQAFTPVVLQAAWRRLQDFLVDMGAARFEAETTLAVPATLSADPGSRNWISATQFFNGSGTVGFPILPDTLISPIWCKEQVGGANYVSMDAAKRGIPDTPKATRQQFWEWHADALWLPGSTNLTLLKVRYYSYLADFVAPGTTPYAAQPIPIMRALSPLAWLLCYEMALARGGAVAKDFEANAQREAAFILTREPDFPRSSESTPKPASVAQTIAGGAQ